MSLPIDDVLSILRDHIVDQTSLKAIAQDLIEAEKEVKESKSTAPKGKTRLVAFVRGDEALKSAVAGGAFVASVPDDDTTATYSGDALVERIRKAAVAHNDKPRKKGRGRTRSKIETWTDAFRCLKSKALKESGSKISIKQKGENVEVVVLTTEKV